MEIMDNTKAGIRCKNYLINILGENINKKELICWLHKRKIQVSDIETFNNIAKKHEINELNKIGGFHYFINISNDNFRDNWTVILDYELGREFLTKYGNEYKID